MLVLRREGGSNPPYGFSPSVGSVAGEAMATRQEEPVSDHADAAPEIVARLRAICLEFPEAYEESARVGTRWMIRKRNFAHVLVVNAG